MKFPKIWTGEMESPEITVKIGRSPDTPNSARAIAILVSLPHPHHMEEIVSRINLTLIAVIAPILLITSTIPALSAVSARAESLKADFQDFLPTYIEAINNRDADFLATVHPELPTEMTDFFFDLTLDMMSYAETNGLQPSVACKTYGVCKVTWPQPEGHWAAQTFIRHEGRWLWLSE